MKNHQMDLARGELSASDFSLPTSSDPVRLRNYTVVIGREASGKWAVSIYDAALRLAWQKTGTANFFEAALDGSWGLAQLEIADGLK